MSVVIETTLGDITVDLFLYDRPRACLNFLKLCKIKYYNFNLFHTISRGFIAQTGDPTGTRTGGESIFGIIDGPSKRYFEAENEPRIKHTCPGLLSFVGDEENMIASQFFLTLGDDLTYLDEKHCVFGEVVEGFEILETINEVICDNDDRPYQDVRITHTVVLDDPYPDPEGIRIPSRSPSPSAERLAGGRIAPDEEIDETLGKSTKEIVEMQAEREAKARAHILEMIGDIPDAEMAPPENVLFVCKLNPITNDDDLEIIFSRFGKIKSCEVIRDRKSGDSLQYAFIEFEDQKACEDAYFKMDNVLVDDRRVHVDFSQSVSKVKWLGKGRGVAHFDEKGNKRKTDLNSEIGKGDYKSRSTVIHRSANKDRARKQDSSPENIKEAHSPKRSNKREGSRSPKRRSPEKFQERSKSLKSHRRRSKSPTHKKRNRTPVRGSRSPVGKRRYSRSPDYSAKITDNRYYSPKKWHDSHESTSRRNTKTGFPERKSKSSRRSRSPRKPDKSPNRDRRNHLGEKQSRSPRRKSRSPRRKSQSPLRSSSPKEISKPSRKSSEKEKKLFKDKKVQQKESSRSRSPKRYKSSRERSKSRETEQRSRKRRNDAESLEERFKSPNSKNTAGNRKFKDLSEKKDRKSVSESRDRDSKGNKLAKEKSSSDKKISKEKTEKKVKTTVSSSKKKKSKKYNSSEKSDTDSEEDRRKSKKKKSKKKVESSTESSSEESSSSSEEEIVKKKTNKTKSKRNLKEKRSKKTKRRKSSSSSSSTSSSDSESTDSSSSSSSSSESDNRRKKRSKKKRTKRSSESD